MSFLIHDAPGLVPLRLEALLEELSPPDFRALAARTGSELDEAKRLTLAQQLARALVSRNQLANPKGFGAAQLGLLVELASIGGRAPLPRVPEDALVLIEHGWLFQRQGDYGLELAMPGAYVLQLASWEGEDRRSLRSLLRLLDRRQASVLARHFDPRVVNLAPALSLEPAFVALHQPKLVRQLVRELSPFEAELLKAIVGLGGEVDTEELLDLTREPMRIRVGGSVATRGSGATYELERRGLLISLAPNRHLVANEVRDVVGEKQQRALALRRTKLRRDLEAENFEPTRASFSLDPAPLTMALALLARERKTPVRSHAGTPKTLLKQLATTVGVPVRRAALLATLGRKLGLWDSTAAESLDRIRVGELSELLVDSWVRGVGWDDGRAEPELLRAPQAARQASPSGVLRHVVLDGLKELAAEYWVPLDTFVEYCLADVRASGLTRQLERYRDKTGVEVLSPLEAVERILLDSLVALGVVDVSGEPGGEGVDRPCIRANSRALAWLDGGQASSLTRTAYVAAQTIRVGADASAGSVLSVADLVEVGQSGRVLELVVSRPKVERVILDGATPESIARRLQSLTPLSAEVERLIHAIVQVRASVDYVAASGFIWVDDPELLKELRERRALARLFVDPSPPGGLLVASGVSLERLTLRLRRFGIELRTQLPGPTLRAVRG